MKLLSSDAVQSMNSQETGEVWLYLLTIEHASLPEPIRLSSDAVDTGSRGETYISCRFELVLPDEEEGRVPNARIAIDNVDRRILEAVRLIDSPAVFRPELILASSPDQIEQDYGLFDLVNVTADLATVEGELSLEQWAQEPWPQAIFSPSRFRGLVA